MRFIFYATLLEKGVPQVIYYVCQGGGGVPIPLEAGPEFQATSESLEP